MVADALDKRYQEGRWVSCVHQLARKPKIILEPPKTALFVIDMQNGFCVPEAQFLRKFKEVTPEYYNYYIRRLESIVVPNLQRLRNFFRRNNLEIVQTVISWLTIDGRDRIPADKCIGIDLPPNSWKVEIIDELKPRPNEIVFTRTTSGLFTQHSDVYRVLRSMGIEHIIFGGVATHASIDANVRGAADLFGYSNVLVEDCCATIMGEEIHVATIRSLGAVYAGIASTESVINHLAEQLETSGAGAK